MGSQLALRVSGFRILGPGFGVEGSGFNVYCFGVWVYRG